MKLSDFSSVVQLGVGLHAGTALVQSVAEFTGTPLSRKIDRLTALAEARAARDVDYAECYETALNLAGDLEIKKIQFFNEYKLVVYVSGGFAVGLCVLLAALALAAGWETPIWVATFIISISFGPAGILLWLLHSRWITNTRTLATRVQTLEERLLGGRK
jgi:hypothetical protein